MYKTCLSEWYKIFNKLYQEVNKRNISKSKTEKIKLTLKMMNENVATGEPSNERYIATVSNAALAEDIMGLATHYYFEDDEVIEFLQKTKCPTTDNIEKLIYQKMYDLYKNDVLVIDDFKFMKAYMREVMAESGSTIFSFNLHTHKLGITCLFSLSKKHELIVHLVCDYFFSSVGLEQIHRYENNEENLSKEDAESLKIIRFAINFLFYQNTFPECILDRVPKDVSSKKYSGKTVKGSSVVIVPKDERRIGVSHFRSGCFVTYTDPRYKGARFETRWRRATFVNGKENKTVVANKI